MSIKMCTQVTADSRKKAIYELSSYMNEKTEYFISISVQYNKNFIE